MNVYPRVPGPLVLDTNVISETMTPRSESLVNPTAATSQRPCRRRRSDISRSTSRWMSRAAIV